MVKKAIYPGSFDPFTNGHLDIVKKASALFDEVDIVIGINSSKRRSFDATEVENAILETLKLNGITNCRVCTHEGLVAAFAKDNNIRYMIRGLRNNMDYNYEENIAEINKLINPHLEYVYFRAENIAVSSSMVKELNSYGHDVSSFVPLPVLEVIKG
jgi:pantetheine-phosphate adenylyltransferase